MPTPKVSTRNSAALARLIQSRESFRTHGALSGHSGPLKSTGQLPTEYYDSAKQADYVVYSYSTPIAWHRTDQWVVPDTRYSVTTSQHQGRVGYALHDFYPAVTV